MTCAMMCWRQSLCAVTCDMICYYDMCYDVLRDSPCALSGTDVRYGATRKPCPASTGQCHLR
eukprot:401474-Rhodomonas_salina.2